MKFATYLAIIFAVLNFVNALPFPQFEDGELALTCPITNYIKVQVKSNHNWISIFKSDL